MNINQYHIGPKTQEDATIPFALMGDYQYVGIAAMTFRRLVLRHDFSFSRYNWRDMGGKWDIDKKGACDWREPLLCLEPTGRKEPEVLRVRIAEDRTVLLVPTADFQSEKPYSTASRNVYIKLDFPRVIACIDADPYSNALSAGDKYYAIGKRAESGHYRVVGKNKRPRWYPKHCFQNLHAPIRSL